MSKLDDQYRFDIDTVMTRDTSDITILCLKCRWFAEIPTPFTLAELVQRADEHTEVCR